MKNTSKLTFSAIMSALAVIFVVAAYFPYLTYALPAIAGLAAMAVLIETDAKWATLTYISSALICFFVAESEAKLLYICFFGYYPIAKYFIEKLKNSVFEWILKFIFFNAAVLAAYFLFAGLFKVSAEDFGILGKYGSYIFLGLANIVFVLYDITVSRMAAVYMFKLHSRIKKIFKV
ncbi:MAG: hypothetical protein PUF48_03005 [Oscillospiraceae bacterium]|nr:hypothetical protein [Oscillospiraceae bacterium]